MLIILIKFQHDIPESHGIKERFVVCKILFAKKVDENTICHTYLTLAGEMSNSMMVNFQVYSTFPNKAIVELLDGNQVKEGMFSNFKNISKYSNGFLL